jgi:LAO/AO transport system kinase
VPEATRGDPHHSVGVDLTWLLQAAANGDARALARLLSYVESRADLLPAVLAGLRRPSQPAEVVGLTGAPGVGKSTCVAALVRCYREQGRRVAVLAVDPSSPLSGGAVLGDRVRMQEHAGDASVFVRSVATRGRLGGLGWTTPAAVRLMESVGFDVVLVETVGVGQSEVDVAALADTTVVMLAPGLGDGIQAAKAGVLEVADILVVNKADREGADQVRRDLLGMVRLTPRHPGDWRPPVVTTVASTGEGIGEMHSRVAEHQRWLDAAGRRESLRVQRARREIEAAALRAVREELASGGAGQDLDRLAEEVAAGRVDPAEAASRLRGASRDSSGSLR